MAKNDLYCHDINLEINYEEPNEVTYDAMEAAKNEDELCDPFNSIKDFMESLNA